MKEDTITRTRLSEVVYQELGLSRNECTSFVDDFFDILFDELVAGRSVKISGFGTFFLIEKDQRVGRNPKTGKEAVITPRKVVSFKASQHLKDVVNR